MDILNENMKRFNTKNLHEATGVEITDAKGNKRLVMSVRDIAKFAKDTGRSPIEMIKMHVETLRDSDWDRRQMAAELLGVIAGIF